MYITSDATSCSGNVAAFAIPCLYDWDTNRPIIGMLNLCQLALTNYSPDKLLATTIHEITHALVSPCRDCKCNSHPLLSHGGFQAGL